MTIWQRAKRLTTVGEARDYFDAHAEDGGDPETMEECERVLDATQHPTDGHGGVKQPPYPGPPEDQIEEEGAD
jgi:hypothetical protein